MSNILFYLKGVSGQIEVYEDRIVINRKGFAAHGIHGLAGNKTIPIKSIQSVQFKEGTSFTNGFIQFGILGGIEVRGGLSSAIYDENSVIFKKSSNTNAKEIKDFLENKIFNMSDNTIQTNKEQISVADEIIKYKQLLDSGIINQQEFETKKKEILNVEENVNTEIEEEIVHNSNIGSKQKNKWVTFCLCLFLGIYGGHKFYEGKIGMGFLYMFTGGLFFVGWLIDLIKILTKPNIYYV